MDSRRLAEAIRAGGGPQLQELIDELRRQDTAEITRILSELTRSSDWDVRGWVSWAAPRMLQSRAEPLLRQLVDDVHPDVGTEAIDALLEPDERHVREFVPMFIDVARGEDPQTALWAIFRLTRYRIPDAGPLFRELADSAKMPAVRNHAMVFLLVIEGREEALLAGLHTEDHSLMYVWTLGAIYLGTQRAVDELAALAQTDPHAECRGYAERALEVRLHTAPKGLH